MIDTVTLGVDIGGTKMVAGVVDRTGVVIERREVPTDARLGGNAVLAKCVQLVGSFLTRFPVSAVGIGTAGVVRPEDDRVAFATDVIPDWERCDLIGAVGDLGSLSVSVLNDVHAHAVGEWFRGAAQGYDSALIVAVGTGIGGGLILRNELFRGTNGAAGHVGHLPSKEAAGLKCSCGRLGHLEAVASGPGILRLYRSLGGREAYRDTRELMFATNTDRLALVAVTTAARSLGQAVGGLVNTLDPACVVVTGGVSNSSELWWQVLRQEFRETVLPSLQNTHMIPSLLNGDGAIVGAAIVARERLERDDA